MVLKVYSADVGHLKKEQMTMIKDTDSLKKKKNEDASASLLQPIKNNLFIFRNNAFYMLFLSVQVILCVVNIPFKLNKY